MTQPDEDALNVMKQTGEEFAYTQLCRWIQNDWHMEPEVQQQQIAHWRAVKDRIGEIVRLIKQEMKEAGK